MNPQFSESENHGIDAMPEDALRVLSVGISTGAIAELRMAESSPERYIVATTIDSEGVAYAKKLIAENGYERQIELKLEDVSQPLKYVDGCFDYVYARLVLHYLPKDELNQALVELHRVLRPGGKIFIVVRSTECPDAHREGTTYNDTTGLTVCVVSNPDGTSYSYARYFHSQETISVPVRDAGFTIEYINQYDEKLFKDFMRTVPSDHTDNIIELLATRS